ncbi:MAG: DNA mismatch repair endonuclease MutL [Candidatus Avigastranaerophilus sp.]
MKRIKQLSVNLINQIAAGEVIERPYSVVKELVENSIDAGATKIEINISNECRNIRIADNGSGIHPDDIELAFSKHATSKLTDEASLFNIKTLGFRGEALASIISIAKVTCTTRTKDFDYGTKVVSQNSVVNASQAGCAQGTIMEVNDLFFNQPARLKFLKSAKTEFSYIQELVQSLALSNPKIAFILKNNNQTVISTTGNADLLTRITELFSNNIINELKEVSKTDDLTGIKLTGYISTPEYTRSSKKTMYTFVNSRTIRCPIIMKAIDIAYKNMMPQGRYPFVVLNLDINPEEIDVNAHPTKREIRYKNPNQIFNFVQSAISYTLNAAVQNHTPFPQKDTKIIDFNSYTSIDFQKNNQENDPDDYEISLNTLQRITDKPGLLYEKADEAEQKKIEINFEQPSKQKHINVIGQFKNTYILVENEDNLELIDQHIAQERYIYEKLKNQKEAASQLLIISDVLDVMPEEIDILENAKSHLNKYGYKIDKISNNQIIFRKIPQILSKVKPQDILSELLENLKDAPENELDTTEERILITTACKASVKAGERLTLWQMEEIVKQLRSTKNPYTCPHGRPISHFISHKEIASYFARSLEKKEK